jgi:TolA-binding protein
MKSEEGPERLMDGQEFGPALRAFTHDDVPAERLERNRSAVRMRIALLPALGLLAWFKSTAKAATTVKLLTAAAAVSTAAAVVVWRAQPDSKPPPHPAAMRMAKAPAIPEAEVDGVPVDALPGPSAPPSAVPTVPDHQPPHRRARPPQSSDELAAQLKLFKEAQASLSRGAYDDAINELDALMVRFPGSPLLPEASLTRAECLARAGRTQAAVVLIQQLLANPHLTERRAELHLMLGQMWLRSQRCDLAAPELETAIASGLPAGASVTARQSLEQCEGRR